MEGCSMSATNFVERLINPARAVASSIGTLWIKSIRAVFDQGLCVNDEYLEVLGFSFLLTGILDRDPVLDALIDPVALTEMRKVFRSREPNRFGHSYADHMRGPRPGSAVSSIVTSLRDKLDTRQATITITPNDSGKVPCINVLQFLVRDSCLVLQTFARAQDMFNKFHLDMICICEIAAEIARELNLDNLIVLGNIASAHVYCSDIDKAVSMLGPLRYKDAFGEALA
jgi:hypothetical protein